ncbi:hypothetical protein [Kitasatospora sp. NPDC059599]|uniref:hypothetical protein n=1 Tax=Kitasatospora sp. NPDC059599 TaxID=3346880 RepID=UPI0036C704C1
MLWASSSRTWSTTRLDAAWQHLADAQAVVLAALAVGRRTARLASALAEFTDAIRTFHHAVETVIGDFAHGEVARLSEETARAASAGTGQTFEWTPTHQVTLRALIADTFSNLRVSVRVG